MRYLATLLSLVPFVASAQSAGVLSPEEIQQLEIQVARNPSDRHAQIALGRNYAFAILGITSLGQYDRVTGMEPTRAASPLAQHARDVLASSTNAGVLAESGKALWSYATDAQSYSVLTLHKHTTYYVESALGIAALDRAISVDPKTADWRTYRIPITVSRSNFKFVLPLDVPEAYALVKDDLSALTGWSRIHMMAYGAKLAVRAANLDDAQAYARELLTNSAKDLDEGNAIYFGNMVLGQVALRRGEPLTAIGYLLASGRTKGSPTLNTFGPNMTLAKELLATGSSAARQAVLEFFDLCAVFWTLHPETLKEWSEVVRNGGMPDFGANLIY